MSTQACAFIVLVSYSEPKLGYDTAYALSSTAEQSQNHAEVGENNSLHGTGNWLAAVATKEGGGGGGGGRWGVDRGREREGLGGTYFSPCAASWRRAAIAAP